LVTQTTDPSWTPLFLKAAGLVVQHGGLLSHGAITAREFGIPAVVGVKNVLNIVKTGTQLVVHGSDGTVELLNVTI